MVPIESKGLLLRFPSAAGVGMAGAAASLDAAAKNIGWELEPILSTESETLGLSFGGEHHWFAGRPKGAGATSSDWNAAYEVFARLAQGRALSATSAPDFIEPDLVQQWPHDQLSNEADDAVALGADACVFSDQDESVPFRSKEFAWHISDAFSQLRAARNRIKKPAVVRIAHLDTGYDPKHETFPKNEMEATLQRSFIDGDDPKSAVDAGREGLLRNPGHGTGTLSILAGSTFKFSSNGYKFDDVLGGAPGVRIVPIRVGNSVVQLTTSSVARGISYAVDLCSDPKTRIDVVSMSMGGVASAAWADAINKAYEAGVVFVAAAGNNYSGLPTRLLVYPARFDRVIAVCGVMADGKPYYDLPTRVMQGNWGPASRMGSAISAYTPNIAWAHWGCPKIVRMDGQGTSAATPQVAAAAALYLQAHEAALFDRKQFREPWVRVEAVRSALFGAAAKLADEASAKKTGNGILRAAEALKRVPDRKTLQMTDPDRAGIPFLNVLNPFGMTGSPLDRMLQLEATQLSQRWTDSDGAENPFEAVVPDPDREDRAPHPKQVREFLEALAEHREASEPLKQRVKQVLFDMGDGPVVKGGGPKQPKVRPASRGRIPKLDPTVEYEPAPLSIPTPPYRVLRGYAVDPSLSTSVDTASISEMNFNIPWEPLKPGPVGEYLEVIDVDPPSKCFYEPIDLDHPRLLAQGGLPPSEGIPQFHQQMVYAVASLTIRNFERALGRRTLWRPGPPPAGENPKNDSHFVPRLRIYPHALREANAYYSPARIALMFGYFNADESDPARHMPGSQVFTCLSHDVVAHETTHALLDGMHRRFMLASNPDVHAFHEAFADCVALFQHFTFPELLAHQIANTRGEIGEHENVLGQLAGEFGRATGRRSALRDAVGHVENGKWTPKEPDPEEYKRTMEPHARGAILVAAVFDAFLTIYKHRSADLLRLATGGTGLLRPGAIHPDLVNRLADEAAKSAQHVLTMCIRALDYSPPTDITFGEFLRAIITADIDVVPNDTYNYRVAFVEAFRNRGIYPPGVRTLSVGSLLWLPCEGGHQPSNQLLKFLAKLRRQHRDNIYARSRERIFRSQRAMRSRLHRWLKVEHFPTAAGIADAEFLGIDPKQNFEVHTARFVNRDSPDGDAVPQLIVGLLQDTEVPADTSDTGAGGPKMLFEGGCTLITDLHTGRIRYCVRKNATSASRRAKQQAFAMTQFDSLRATYLGARALDVKDSPFSREPFAMIHRGGLL